MSRQPASKAPLPSDEATTGFSGILRSWRTVYLFVVLVFALVVSLLAALPHFFA